MVTDKPSWTTLQEAELFEELHRAIRVGDLAHRDAILAACPQLQEWLEGLQIAHEHVANDPAATVLRAPPSSSPPPPFTGPWGRYELLEVVGRGGMGVVYRALHRELNRQVALKMILHNDLASWEDLQRFRTEARIVAQLRHPNIVAVHDVDEHLGRPFFAMDFVDGENLAVLVARGYVSVEQAARWVMVIARAVQHLHERGIIHRDLKPSNILIDGRGEPIVTDFGLAKLFDSEGQATHTGAILGTPSYMPPEQASGRTSLVSPRSDVYSLGAILYELLTGRPPFRGESPLDTLVQVLESEPTLPRQLVPSVPRALEVICLKCLEKAPGRRYHTAVQLADDLARFLDGDPIEAQPGGPLHRLHRWMRREPNLACHLLGLTIGLLILQIAYPFNGVSFSVHMQIMTTLSIWLLSSLIGHILLKRERYAEFGRWGTIIGDVGFLTSGLALTGGAIGPILSAYALLISVSGLWSRPKLVWMATIAAQGGYGLLLALNPVLRVPWHYPLLVFTVLFLVGATTVFQVQRVRALSRFCDRQSMT